MAETLDAKIVVDASDVAKIALARAEWQAQSAALRDAANAAREAGDAQGTSLAALDAVAAKATQAKEKLDGLTGSLRKQTNALGETGSGLTRFRYEMEALTDPVRGVRANLGAIGEAFAGAFVFDRVIEAIEKTAEWGEGLVKLSKITGVSVDTLAAWRYGAEQVGVAAGALDQALPRLGQHIGEALTSQTSQAALAFRALGITSDELKAHSNDLEWVLMRMADAFHTHAAGGNAAAIAMDVLGRSGAALIPWLQQARDGIAQMTAKFHGLHGEITGEMAEALEQHRQAVKDMTEVWGGFWEELVYNVSPALTHLAEQLTSVITSDANGALMNQLQAQEASLVKQLAAARSAPDLLSRWFPDSGLDKVKQIEAALRVVREQMEGLARRRPGPTRP